jgi:hypothetical protein
VLRSHGHGVSFALILMTAFILWVLTLAVEGGWGLFLAVMLVVTVAQLVFVGVHIVGRHWRHPSAHAHRRLPTDTENPG